MVKRTSSERRRKDLRIAYIIGTYPGLTTTFIDREITMLQKWGVNLHIVSIRQPSTPLSEEQEDLRRVVIYLMPVNWPSFLRAHFRFALLCPKGYFSTLLYLMASPHPSMKSWLMTFFHFIEGVYATYLLRGYSLNHIHAHFIDRAAVVALVASRLLKVSYSLTAHANDIYVNPVLLYEKVSQAKFVATCTNYNKTYLSQLRDGLFDHKLKCIYHGLDVAKYQHRSLPKEERMILAVGQLKEKKGFCYLLRACHILRDKGYDLKCQIVGDGPLRENLEREINQLSLQDVVTLCGALPHKEVVNKYQQAAIFVLPATLSSDNDRDGIPNVILEAMAMELPVISTRHSGIPEVIEDQKNGVLVPPADEIALAEAIASLLDYQEQRQIYGRCGRQTIIEKFRLEQNTARLLAEFTA